MEEQNTNQNQEANQEVPKNPAPEQPKSKSGLIFILFLLIIIIGVVTWLYIDQRSTTKEIETVLTAEKDSIRANLERLRMEYDSLQTDNDSINVQLGREKERIDGLISELKYVKATNYAKIKELQKELGTVRAVAKSYIKQIDSLNTLNQELVAENIKVKNEIQQVTKSKDELEEQNKDLSGKVELASTLSASNIDIQPINSRGKIRTKASKVVRIKVCLTVNENVLAEGGDMDVFLRIAGPDDYILAKSEDDLFEFDGKMIIYSAKRPIEYNNQDMDVCIYFENNGELIPGTYDVYVFTQGYEIGQASFELVD